MDIQKNPFAPGAGYPPPALVGRQDILDKANIAFARLSTGKPEKSFLLVGLRGVGKTVLLNKINEITEKVGYNSIYVEAHEKKPLAVLLLPHLRKLLFDLDSGSINQKVKKGFRVLKSFLNSLRVKYESFEIGLDLDVEPELGSADSGDLEADMTSLLLSIAEATKERKKSIAILVDELQYFSEIELSALIMAIHRISQKQLPLILVGAGLPQIIGLTGRSKSYAERLFDFCSIDYLEREDAFYALQNPVKNLGAHFQESALEEILFQTKGYPYFLQEWGYQSWNLADSSEISLEVVKQATKVSLKKLDEGFFRVRFDRLTPKEKEYLRALAAFGSGTHRSGNIAEHLHMKPQSLAPIRNNLIKKGMIYSPAHGDTEFTVPLFHDFMRRVMPESTR